MSFKMRTTKPSGNKFYITKSRGGYSLCVVGSPTDPKANVLANCVGYACGRFNEIIGKMKYPTLNCNAENFIERAKSLGLKVSSKPTLGGIMVWQKGATLSGNDGAGHVAIVERINSSNSIYTSESGWGGPTFFNATKTNSNGRWGMASGYKFRGCIVNPAVKVENKLNLARVLQKGSTGTAVENLQKALNKDLGTKLKIDGIFGNATYKAVLKYQDKYGIKVWRGKVGKVMAHKLGWLWKGK